MQSVDKMTDDELALALLELMDDAKWRAGDILHIPERHMFATEVREFMRKKNWYCVDITKPHTFSEVFFWKDAPTLEIMGESAIYSNMDEYPGAVYEAALQALENENV